MGTRYGEERVEEEVNYMPKIYVQLKDTPWSKAGTEWGMTYEKAVQDSDTVSMECLSENHFQGCNIQLFPLSSFSEWFKKKKEERWRAKFEKRYYVIKENTINWYIEDNNHTDDRNYSIGNCFQTREEAEQCYQEYILPAFKKYWEDRGMEV